MDAFLSAQEARRLPFTKIVVGGTYTFYSTCVECKTNSGLLVRWYSGQAVTVTGFQPMTDNDTEQVYHVYASNGDTFDVLESEIDGFIFKTGQWVGPRVH